MIFSELKAKLLSLFDAEKLGKKPGEWGFANETADKEIKRVGYATNLTPDIVLRGGECSVDFIITHHDAWDFLYGMKEKCLQILGEKDIIHAFFHAPLDDTDFGTSASLAETLGLRNRRKTIIYEDVFYCAVIGEFEEGQSLDGFSMRLADALDEAIISYKNKDGPIRKVCVTSGAGDMTEHIKIAADEGCDAYITGEHSLYSKLYAKFAGINLFVGSHTNTEILGVKGMAELLARDTGVELIRIEEENY
ncbi:MAG: Nif3-like dinuclear metal center hexameric protein [Oscillospiraceae bacterium]|jgi:putative NIF3 family GTP cyclohydrolase 1 type 2|nr:Nif3-like dinuclear metal center hexameric protein [Oscillospiraceae bacterium]